LAFNKFSLIFSGKKLLEAGKRIIIPAKINNCCGKEII